MTRQAIDAAREEAVLAEQEARELAIVREVMGRPDVPGSGDDTPESGLDARVPSGPSHALPMGVIIAERALRLARAETARAVRLTIEVTSMTAMLARVNNREHHS